MCSYAHCSLAIILNTAALVLWISNIYITQDDIVIETGLCGRTWFINNIDCRILGIVALLRSSFTAATGGSLCRRQAHQVGRTTMAKLILCCYIIPQPDMASRSGTYWIHCCTNDRADHLRKSSAIPYISQPERKSSLWGQTALQFCTIEKIQ